MSTLDPDTLRWLLAELLGLLLVAAFFSATEAALTALNRNRIKQLAEAGQADASRVLRLLKQPERIAGLGLIANYLVLVLVTQIGAVIALNGFAYEASLPLSLIIAAVLVVFGAVIPRTLAGLAPERWAAFSAPLVLPLVWLSRPLTALLTDLPRRLLQGMAGGPPPRATCTRRACASTSAGRRGGTRASTPRSARCRTATPLRRWARAWLTCWRA
jgi:Mg2+/Co2+ transporter CorB